MIEETPMTIDELARMVADGFVNLQRSMEVSMQKSMREMEERLNARIDKVVDVHEDHSRRIKNLELKVG